MARSDHSSVEDQWCPGTLDAALDRSVVLGYTWPGLAIRRSQWSASDRRAGDVRGRHIVVTGGTSGIGKSAAGTLARLGATVHVVGHQPGRLDEALDDLRRDGDVVGHVCDVADLDDVRSLAATLRSDVPEVHGLLHNAGTMTPERTESRQGHELTLATHVLGPFLLTHLLAPHLSPTGRVVFMSSGGMYSQPIGIDDLEYRSGFSGPKAYARTKRMLVDLAEVWADELPTGRTAHSMHPGWVDTPGVAKYLPKFRAVTLPMMRTPAQGADTLVWLAASEAPGHVSGRFWHDRRIRPTSFGGRHATSDADRGRLWEYCRSAVDHS